MKKKIPFPRHLYAAAVIMGTILGVNAPSAMEGKNMEKQPEEQNLLVDFGKTPEAPEPPDIGIALRVWPAQVKEGEPVFLAGSYSADGPLIILCKQNLAACVRLTLVRLGIGSIFQVTRPLITPNAKVNPPPPGEYSQYYRLGGQFKLDIVAFFDLPKTPAVYTITGTLGTYTSGPHTFTVGVP